MSKQIKKKKKKWERSIDLYISIRVLVYYMEIIKKTN